jgi:hypothetical protein
MAGLATARNQCRNALAAGSVDLAGYPRPRSGNEAFRTQWGSNDISTGTDRHKPLSHLFGTSFPASVPIQPSKQLASL